METFPATFFAFSTRYPESGTRLELGRSYLYTQAPDAPDQRLFTLSLQGMCYFLDQEGAPDLLTQLGRNMFVFEDFYLAHRLHKSFLFQHPLYGETTCKFNQPLQTPEGVTGGGGVLPTFNVELIEIP